MVILVREIFSKFIGRSKVRNKNVEKLFTASCHGDIDKIEELIEAGVDIRTEDEAALRLAAWWGCKDVAALLMDRDFERAADEGQGDGRAMAGRWQGSGFIGRAETGFALAQ